MSIRVMTRVWDTARAEGGALLVLLALADSADEAGYCWPDPGDIASRARLSDRQVRTVLKILSQAGEIAYHTGRGRRARSWYVVLSGLTDAEKETRRQGLHERINRKSVPYSSAEKRKNLPHSGVEKRKEFPEKTSAFPEECGSLAQEKRKFGACSHGDVADPAAPNTDPIRHDPGGGGGDHDPESNSTTTTHRTNARKRTAGDGGPASNVPAPTYPETVAFLLDVPVAAAAAFGDIPLDIAQVALATARRHPNPGDVGALTASLLKRYRRGEWRPPAPSAPPEPVPAAELPPPLDLSDPVGVARQLLGDSAAEAEIAVLAELIAHHGDVGLAMSAYDERRRQARRPPPPVAPGAEEGAQPLAALWQAALRGLEQQLPRQDVDTWLQHASLLALDGGTATLGAPSPFHKEALENRFLAPVRRSLGTVVGYPVQVRVVVHATRTERATR